MKATSEWFPAQERGLAGGVFNIGASFGSMLAPPLVAWAILAYNWQSAFVIDRRARPGVGGAVALALPSARQAPRAVGRRNGSTSCPDRSSTSRVTARRPSIGRILTQRNFWGIALPRFLADPTWGTLTFWLPLYLTTVRHFDLKQIALFAWLPFLAADLGCLCGGTISLALQKRFGMSLINARRSAFTVGACLMVGVAFVGFVESPYVAIALLSLAGFAHQTLSVTVITMSSDLFKRNEVATVAGMAGTCGNAGVLLFSLLIGYARHQHRLLAVLRRPRGARSAGRRPAVDARARASTRLDRPAAGRGRRLIAMAVATPRIRNPILPGFNPDPSIVRVGDDYYIATSTFEWFPGVQIHHSRDLVHWRLLTRPLTRASQLNMLGDPDSCGVWAPCLTYADGLFHLDLHRREALRPHVAGGRRGRVAARFPQLPRHEPANRRRLVGSRLPEQQRLRPVALPRRRRPQVPAEHAVGPPAGTESLRRDRAAGVLDRSAHADRRAARDLSKARRLASPKRRTSTSATVTTT